MAPAKSQAVCAHIRIRTGASVSSQSSSRIIDATAATLAAISAAKLSAVRSGRRAGACAPAAAAAAAARAFWPPLPY